MALEFYVKAEKIIVEMQASGLTKTSPVTEGMIKVMRAKKTGWFAR